MCDMGTQCICRSSQLTAAIFCPVQVEVVEQMCRDIMDFSQGKQKVKSSGIMEFGMSRDQYEPNVFYTWERYDSNSSLGRHNTCPEFQAFMENVRNAPPAMLR